MKSLFRESDLKIIQKSSKIHPQIHQKSIKNRINNHIKNNWFLIDFWCQNASKMFPQPPQNRPSYAQDGPKAAKVETKMAIWTPSWPILGATCSHLGLTLLILPATFQKMLAQARQRRRTEDQDPSSHRFSSILGPSWWRFSLILEAILTSPGHVWYMFVQVLRNSSDS